MKKTVFLIFCVLWFLDAAKSEVYADMNLEAESALSGISVAFNNYYARNMFPEQSLAQSVELVGEGTLKINTEDAPAVIELVEREKDRQVELISPEAYENVAISKVEDFVEIKTGMEEDSDIVGRIYNHSAAQIVDMLEVSGKQWYLIESGNVSGYVEAEYFVTGENAKDIAEDIAIIYGTVENTESLRLRSEPSREAQTLTLLAEESTYVVLGEEGDFLKIQVDDDLVGYAFKDYIRTEISFDRALSLEDEERKAKELEDRKKEAQEAIAKLEEAKRNEKEKKEGAQKSGEAKEESSTKNQESKTAKKEESKTQESKTRKEEGSQKQESSSARTTKSETLQSLIESAPSVKQTQTIAAKPKDASTEGQSASRQAAKESKKTSTAEETIESLAQAVPSAQAPVPAETSQKEGKKTQSSGKENSVEALTRETEASPSQKESTKESTEAKKKESMAQKAKSSPEVSTATRDAIVAYAKQFVGNPYVYGGTSLTEGADCSGFTMQVYSNFGYSLGRSSRDQAGKGRTISEEEIRPGDLVFYASGSYINHVAIYIGQGKVVHASNERTGIIISSMKYRSPVKIISFLD